METITINKDELKTLINNAVKDALNEALEHKLLLIDKDDYEDYLFGLILKESDTGETVSEKEIFDILDNIK